mmetsp:Transcript_7789/g.22756  ORF Transcript_7789/g.22756 Transcript_7789/m.22756 type:complete len:470 (-) Transcript_7789:175-1584(-)
MEAASASKRRKLNLSVVNRSHGELKEALEFLYSRTQYEADDASDTSHMVVVRAVGRTGSEREFRCMRSLLASASRPLEAMLYGCNGLRMQESVMTHITLHDTEPATFELLLDYVHGKAVHLDETRATDLYLLADYHVIASLREHCRVFLANCIKASRLCHWFDLSRRLNCELLVQKCQETLQSEFSNVASSDPQFTSLSEADLMDAVRSSQLVCIKEDDVWEVVQRWAQERPDTDEVLARFAPHIRWPLMAQPTLNDLALHNGASTYLKPFLEEAKRYRGATAGDKDALLLFMDQRADPRQYLLGELAVMDKDGVLTKVVTLKPNEECTIGRSRRANIIFSNPFVSSIHCSVSSKIAEVGSGTCSVLQLQPRLVDLSSNGAYVNQERVGRDQTKALNDGDVISVVRPNSNEDVHTNVGWVVYRHKVSSCAAIQQVMDAPADASGNDTEGAEGGANAHGGDDVPALTPDE